MSEEAAPRISAGQFFWCAAAGMVAGGVFVWPTPLILSAGADWAWALATDGVLVALTLGAQLLWGERVTGKAMYGRLRTLWGPLAWPWMLGTSAVAVTIEAVLLDLFVDMLQTFFFPATPAWPLRLLLAGIALVLASQSLDTLARNIRTWFLLGLAGFAFMAALTAAQASTPAALRPPWPPAVTGVLAGVAGTWLFWNDDGGVALTLASYTRGATWSGARRWALGAAAFQLTTLAIITVVTLAVIGPWALQTEVWPMLVLMVGAGPTSLSFLRPSLLILPVWTGAFVSYLAVHAYSLSLNTRAAVGAPPSARRWHALAITAAVLIVAWQLPSAPVLSHLAIQDLGPLALGWGVALHGTSLALATLRRLGRPRPVGQSS